MKRRKYYVVLIAAIMVFAGGCGNGTETDVHTVEEAESGEMDEAAEEDSATAENPSGEVQDIDSLIVETGDSELDLKEYYYSFEDRTAGKTDNDAFSGKEFQFVGDGFYYITTGKVSLYAENGVRMGYTKEDVDFSVVAACGDWCYFYLDNEKRYARLSDIEANSLGPEEIDAMNAEREAEERAKAQPQTQSAVPAGQTSSQENIPDTAAKEAASVPDADDKYTPEEAVSVYRKIMEGGGIIWDPSLKDVSSWGTGWIYLEKGMPEWLGTTDLEAFAYGDTVGNPWTRYYLEVTDTDDECVYITEWHN